MVNDNLDICYDKILSIIMSEKRGVNQKQDKIEIKKKVEELIK